MAFPILLGSTLWSCVIVAEVFMYGLFPILVDLSRKENTISFLSTSMNFQVEAAKLIICGIILCLEVRNGKRPCQEVKFKMIISYSVPAFLYCINNNVAVWIQTQMDPATYMVLGNLKILFTAVLYRLILKKEITLKQWLAITLLMCGGIMNSVSALASKDIVSLSVIHVTWIGLITLFCYCFISGFAAVYTEYILKNNEQSVYFQNAILYTFGIIFSFVGWLVQANNEAIATGNYEAFNLFYGYTAFTWALVLTQAPLGIIFSLIMKYNNNIVRLFIISSAPLVTTVLSHFVFGLQIKAEFTISAVFILVAAVLYNQKSSQKKLVPLIKSTQI